MGSPRPFAGGHTADSSRILGRKPRFRGSGWSWAAAASATRGCVEIRPQAAQCSSGPSPPPDRGAIAVAARLPTRRGRPLPGWGRAPEREVGARLADPAHQPHADPCLHRPRRLPANRWPGHLTSRDVGEGADAHVVTGSGPELHARAHASTHGALSASYAPDRGNESGRGVASKLVTV